MASKIMNLLKIVYDFLFKVKDLTFPLLLTNKRPRRSIVRYIGSMLPLPSAPKMYIYLPAFQSSLKTISPSETLYSLPTDDEDSSRGNETTSDWSDAACVHDATIQQLQQELKSLREQVAAILLKQADIPSGPKKKRSLNQVRRLIKSPRRRGSKSEEPTKCSAPPPPPPPPPPLPTFVSVPLSTQVTPVRPRKPLSARNDQGDPLSAVLMEMKNGRPKLKPIERSPGGRPVKPPKKVSDPSDILTEVLKQRFIAANFSPESESESSGTDVVASEWKTCFI